MLRRLWYWETQTVNAMAAEEGKLNMRPYPRGAPVIALSAAIILAVATSPVFGGLVGFGKSGGRVDSPPPPGPRLQAQALRLAEGYPSRLPVVYRGSYSRCRRLLRAARQAGWRHDQLRVLVAVAWAESNCRSDARNVGKWEDSTGPLQINRAVWKISRSCAQDYYCSAKYARQIHRLQGWNAWTVYKKGIHHKYLVWVDHMFADSVIYWAGR